MPKHKGKRAFNLASASPERMTLLPVSTYSRTTTVLLFPGIGRTFFMNKKCRTLYPGDGQRPMYSRNVCLQHLGLTNEMKQISIAWVLLAACAAHGGTGMVESVQFKTAVTPPACKIPDSLKQNETLFRAGLQTLPEGLLVVGALLVGSGDLGLSADQVTSLTPLVSDVYAKIYADGAFSNAPSALPYCFSPTKPTSGHYFLYRPDKIPENPTCIVFLHGYGGNFQFYTWVLKEEFHDAVILTPSWGISWHRGSTTYLKDALADAERRTGASLSKPWLMGISAGGRGGFPIYNQMPAVFQGYVCIANAPETEIARALRSDLRILMLNGTDDDMVPLRIARQQVQLAKQRVPTLRYQEIKGNHFFLLSDRTNTFGVIREFMKDREPRTKEKP